MSNSINKKKIFKGLSTANETHKKSSFTEQKEKTRVICKSNWLKQATFFPNASVATELTIYPRWAFHIQIKLFFSETALFKNEFNRTLTDVNQTSAVLLLFHFQSITAKATEAEERDTAVCNFLSK